MALSADQVINTVMAYNDPEGLKFDYNVAASTTIYKNGFVGLDTGGNLVMLTAGAASTTLDPFERFIGISMDNVDNSSGSAGDKTCQVLVKGSFQYALSGAAQTDVGMPVFASADNTLTKVSLGNPFIGWIRNYVSSGIVIVSFGETMNNSYPLIARVSAALDCTALNKVSLIHQSENHNGLIILHAFCIVTETIVGSSEDQLVVDLKDTAGTTTGITFTSTDTTPDVAGDVLVANGSPIGLPIGATLGDAIVVVPADEGLSADCTQITAGTPAGIVKVGVLALPIA